MCVFSVDYSAIDKYDILNFHKYLITQKNIKNNDQSVYCSIARPNKMSVFKWWTKNFKTKNRIKNHVNVKVKTIVSVKKIIVGILAHVSARIKSI